MMRTKKDDAYYTVNANQYFFKKRTTQNHHCTNPDCKKTLWTVLNPYDMKLSHNKWIKIGGYGFIYRDFAARHFKKTDSPKVIAKLNEIIDNPEQIFIAKGAYRRYSMSSFIAEHIKNVDGLIADELHLFKGDSGQGSAMETLIGCSDKVIGMTATLINGYSSGLFYLLYRIVPHLMKADNKDYETPQRFNDEYGVTEETYELEESEYNETSKSRKKLTQSRQRPGVSPLVYSRFLMDCAVFLSLNDMGKHLPEYEEIPVVLNMREEIAKEYGRILKNYFWNTPNEREKVEKILSDICENPIGTEVEKLLDMAKESKNSMDETISQMETEGTGKDDKIKAFVVFTQQLMKIYNDLCTLKESDLSEADLDTVRDAENELETMLSEATKQVGMTNIPLAERKMMSI